MLGHRYCKNTQTLVPNCCAESSQILYIIREMGMLCYIHSLLILIIYELTLRLTHATMCDPPRIILQSFDPSLLLDSYDCNSP
jgi:hypothetical protein